MSLRRTITNAVDKVFAACGDLVVLATLTSETVTDWDYTLREPVGVTQTKKIEVILEDTKKASGTDYTTSAIMRTGFDLSVYDTLTVNGRDYKIVDWKDNDFVIEATLKRKGDV